MRASSHKETFSKKRNKVRHFQFTFFSFIVCVQSQASNSYLYNGVFTKEIYDQENVLRHYPSEKYSNDEIDQLMIQELCKRKLTFLRDYWLDGGGIDKLNYLEKKYQIALKGEFKRECFDKIGNFFDNATVLGALVLQTPGAIGGFIATAATKIISQSLKATCLWDRYDSRNLVSNITNEMTQLLLELIGQTKGIRKESISFSEEQYVVKKRFIKNDDLIRNIENRLIQSRGPNSLGSILPEYMENALRLSYEPKRIEKSIEDIEQEFDNDSFFAGFDPDLRSKLKGILGEKFRDSRYDGQDIQLRNSYIFHGEPNTGKSQAARKLVCLLGLPYEEVVISSTDNLRTENIQGTGLIHSQPDCGWLVKALMQGCTNGFIIIDDAQNFSSPDSLTKTFFLNYLDPDKKSFKSNYFNSDIDISRLNIIITLNAIIPQSAEYRNINSRVQYVDFSPLSDDVMKHNANNYLEKLVRWAELPPYFHFSYIDRFFIEFSANSDSKYLKHIPKRLPIQNSKKEDKLLWREFQCDLKNTIGHFEEIYRTEINAIKAIDLIEKQRSNAHETIDKTKEGSSSSRDGKESQQTKILEIPDHISQKIMNLKRIDDFLRQITQDPKGSHQRLINFLKGSSFLGFKQALINTLWTNHSWWEIRPYNLFKKTKSSQALFNRMNRFEDDKDKQVVFNLHFNIIVNILKQLPTLDDLSLIDQQCLSSIKKLQAHLHEILNLDQNDLQHLGLTSETFSEYQARAQFHLMNVEKILDHSYKKDMLEHYEMSTFFPPSQTNSASVMKRNAFLKQTTNLFEKRSSVFEHREKQSPFNTSPFTKQTAKPFEGNASLFEKSEEKPLFDTSLRDKKTHQRKPLNLIGRPQEFYNLDGKILRRQNVSGDGMRCFFNALGLPVDDQIIKLRKNANNKLLRDMIANEIVSAAHDQKSQELHPEIKKIVNFDICDFQLEDTKNLEAKRTSSLKAQNPDPEKTDPKSLPLVLQSKYIGQRGQAALEDLRQRSNTLQAFEAFIKYHLENQQMMTMIRTHDHKNPMATYTSIDAIAYLNNLALKIYGPSGTDLNPLDLVHEYRPDHATEIAYLYHSGTHFQALISP